MTSKRSEPDWTSIFVCGLGFTAMMGLVTHLIKQDQHDSRLQPVTRADQPQQVYGSVIDPVIDPLERVERLQAVISEKDHHIDILLRRIEEIESKLPLGWE